MESQYFEGIKPEYLEKLMDNCDSCERASRERALEWLADELCQIVVEKQA